MVGTQRKVYACFCLVDDDDDMALEVMESPAEDNTAFFLTDRCVTKANKGS